MIRDAIFPIRVSKRLSMVTKVRYIVAHIRKCSSFSVCSRDVKNMLMSPLDSDGGMDVDEFEDAGDQGAPAPTDISLNVQMLASVTFL